MIKYDAKLDRVLQTEKDYRDEIVKYLYMIAFPEVRQSSNCSLEVQTIDR